MWSVPSAECYTKRSAHRSVILGGSYPKTSVYFLRPLHSEQGTPEIGLFSSLFLETAYVSLKL